MENLINIHHYARHDIFLDIIYDVDVKKEASDNTYVVSKNEIIKISEEIFSKYPERRNLELTFIGFDSIPEDLEINLPKLYWLKLQCHGVVKTLPENLFSKLENLGVLCISHIGLETLPENIFHNLKKLKVLRFGV